MVEGSQSGVRPGCQIAGSRWRLHDGCEVDTPSLTVTYHRPGLYSEELSVTTTGGIEDRDYAQVRVYDPERGTDMAWGWVFANPVREIRPGTPVAFWNRLLQTRCVTVDFGDNTPPVPIESETGHAYTQPGLYTVTFSGLGPADEPVMAKLRVLVEP